jgi:hypothetical protein
MYDANGNIIKKRKRQDEEEEQHSGNVFGQVINFNNGNSKIEIRGHGNVNNNNGIVSLVNVIDQQINSFGREGANQKTKINIVGNDFIVSNFGNDFVQHIIPTNVNTFNIAAVREEEKKKEKEKEKNEWRKELDPKKDVKSKETDANSCTICMENLIKTVILPCKHSIMCISCTVELHTTASDKENIKCPICQSKIENVISFF